MAGVSPGRASTTVDGAAGESGRPPQRIRRAHRIGVRSSDAREPVVRLSLDLSVSEHQFLKRFAYDNDVPQSFIGRALVDWLRNDADVAVSLIAKIRSQLDLGEAEQLQAIRDACDRYTTRYGAGARADARLTLAIAATLEAVANRMTALTSFLQ